MRLSTPLTNFRGIFAQNLRIAIYNNVILAWPRAMVVSTRNKTKHKFKHSYVLVFNDAFPSSWKSLYGSFNSGLNEPQFENF